VYRAMHFALDTERKKIEPVIVAIVGIVISAGTVVCSTAGNPSVTIQSGFGYSHLCTEAHSASHRRYWT